MSGQGKFSPQLFCETWICASIQIDHDFPGRDKGGGKTRGGGGSTKITKSKAMATKELDEKIIHLRKAIFADNGRDKNVLAGIAAPFLKFDRNGLNLEISFASKLTVDEEEIVFIRDAHE